MTRSRKRWWICCCCCVASAVFHNDEGLDFTGAIDSWWRVLSQPAVDAYDSNSRKRVTRCLMHQTNAPVTLWPDAAEHADATYNHSNWPIPGSRDVVERIVWERRAFVCARRRVICCFEKNQTRGHLALLDVCEQAGTSNSSPWWSQPSGEGDFR